MEDNKQFQKKLWIGSVIYAFIIVGILVIANAGAVNAWLTDALLLFRPVINGLIIAYLCNPFFRFFERKLFCRLNPPKLRRALSLLCAFLVLFGIITLILVIILPQLIESVLDLATNY
ncbi:MAG: hypothetical protein IJX62_06900, partial [Clostridia bacterium]|nr:hypothetical protein [Clostridia bacterium]